MTTDEEDLQEEWAALGALPNDASRRQLLERFPQWRNLNTLRSLDEGVRVALRVDLRKALFLVEAALAIAAEVNTCEARALALRAKANALYMTGECKLASQHFAEAATLFDRAGNRDDMARTLSSSIQSLVLLGEYERCFRNGQQSARSIYQPW